MSVKFEDSLLLYQDINNG